MEEKFYSAAALAAELNVPRTTINDWLTRYENYIDVQQNGKRKVYPAGSLAVLQEIARLRDSGRSTAEIDNILAQSHGITPEISPMTEAPKAAAPRKSAKKSADETAGQAESTETDEPDAAANLPAIKEFERSAIELTSFIADLRTQQAKSLRRSRMAIGLLVVFIGILLLAAAFLLQVMRLHLAERQSEAARMHEAMEKLNFNFNTELKNIEKARRSEQAAAAASVKALKDELFAQQKARAAEVARLEKQLASDRAAWSKLQARREKELNEKNLAERKLLLEKMELDAARSQQQLDAMKNELISAGEKLKNLSDELKKLSPPPATPAAAVEVKAAEKPATAEEVPEKAAAAEKK